MIKIHFVKEILNDKHANPAFLEQLNEILSNYLDEYENLLLNKLQAEYSEELGTKSENVNSDEF